MANVILSATSESVGTIQTTIWVDVNVLPSQANWFSPNILPIGVSVGVTSQIEEVLRQLRQDWIRIPKPAGVRDYLIRYPDLTSILPFVCKIAREQVGIYSELSLELYRDPEIEDEYLTLYVRERQYDEDILDKIEDVRKRYEEMLMGRSGWLIVTTDFRPSSFNSDHEL